MCSTAEEGEGWKEEVEWKEEGVEGGAGEGGRRKRTATTRMFFDDSDEDGETPAKRRECSWSAALYNSVR